MKKEYRKLDTVEYFDKIANIYDEEIHQQSLGTRYLSFIETDFVSKYLLKNKKEKNRLCLEIGAGTGRFTKLLIKHGYKVEVIECAKKMIEKLEEKFKHSNININNVDAGKEFPYPSNFFYCVLAMRVLKYIPNWKKTIREISRILERDGLFIFSIANLYSIAYFKGAAKYFLFRPKEVIKCLENSGFKIIKISKTTRLPLPLYYKINSSFVLRFIIFIENLLDKLMPFWFLSRGIIFYAKKSNLDNKD